MGSASWTNAGGWVGKLLTHFKLMAAGFATVLVHRHDDMTPYGFCYCVTTL
jgi:hypothetical protein